MRHGGGDEAEVAPGRAETELGVRHDVVLAVRLQRVVDPGRVARVAECGARLGEQARAEVPFGADLEAREVVGAEAIDLLLGLSDIPSWL